MKIPLLDLKRQYDSIRDEVLEVTREVYESQIFILGPKVVEFERAFSSYSGAKHTIGVSSGTDALLVALMVKGVGRGDEVIVPAYSFFATAGVVERLGAVPVFVDVERESFNLDVKMFRDSITSRTKAVIPVHLFGQVAGIDEILAIADDHGISVIEDAAQAVGAKFRGSGAGTFGEMGCFSFFPSKNLGGFGDAGAVTTNDDDLAERLVDFRVHGMRPKYFHRFVGGNFRIDALQAAILHVKLRYLDDWTAARQKNAALYSELLSGPDLDGRLTLPVVLPERRHVFNQYVVRFSEGRDTRDRVMNTMRDAGIGCEIYYPLTLPAQDCFASLPSSSTPFPVSEEAAETSLALPIFAELTIDEIELIAKTVRGALG